jgi:type VI secretion system protein ImpA
MSQRAPRAVGNAVKFDPSCVATRTSWQRKVMAALDSTLASDEPAAEAAPPESVIAPEPAEAAASPPAEPLDPEVAALCTPIAADDPCGPDLDLAGDPAYLNFFAQVEGILPTSFFNALDGMPFDRTAIDIGGQLGAIKPLLARTRDIRLLIMQARLQILNRDLAGFAVSLAATAYWLDGFWDQVHPRPEGGEVLARSNAVAALDIPTVIFPLQYTSLFEARRVGTVSYRALMIATDEVKPRTGEDKLDASAIIEARGEANPAVLTAARKHVAMLKSAVERIRNAFAMQGASAGLDNLPALIGKIQAFIDPVEAAKEAAIDAQDGQEAPAAGSAGPGPSSLAEASEALAAIADYYSRREPSSPALPLVRQAHQLIGKSFIEVISILVPTHLEQAAFQIGGDQVFELPVGKLSDLSATAAPLPNGSGETTAADATEPGSAAVPRFQVGSRAQATTLLEQVQRYFRASEPSSPVPMLCERARAFAERDFMAVLRDVLPKVALKNIGADK